MTEVFEGRDFSGAVFWGVDMRRALIRDAELSGARLFHVMMSDVDIDGEIDRLVVNGVDVTAYVNEHDRWYPLRTQLSPTTEAGVRATWAELQRLWDDLIARARTLGPDAALVSVNGEWSFRDTLRHLVFAIDKWCTWPLLGARTFTSIGLVNGESVDEEWPGIDRTSDPTLDEVLVARALQHEQVSAFVRDLDLASLPPEVDVLENGRVPSVMCLHVVFEEMFEHLRYALRDLDHLDRPDRPAGSTSSS